MQRLIDYLAWCWDDGRAWRLSVGWLLLVLVCALAAGWIVLGVVTGEEAEEYLPEGGATLAVCAAGCVGTTVTLRRRWRNRRS